MNAKIRTHAATAGLLASGLVAGGLLAGSLTANAATTAASTTPAAAASAAPAPRNDAAALADRVAHIKGGLAGLVSNGTITQAQADKVATTLAAQLPPPGDGPGRRGPGGPGGPGRLSPEATAKLLGITVDQLRTAHDAGQTLAQIAAAHGISEADLISKLVAAAKTQLAADVKAGRLTQAQADSISADLTAHITDMVDRVGPPRGQHGDGDGDGPPPAAPSSSTSTTTTPSSTTT